MAQKKMEKKNVLAVLLIISFVLNLAFMSIFFVASFTSYFYATEVSRTVGYVIPKMCDPDEYPYHYELGMDEWEDCEGILKGCVELE